MRNQVKHYAILGSLAILLALMSVTKGMAEDLQQPQQVIKTVSETLKNRLQDKSFTRNFAQVTQFVNGVIYPHTDFDRIAPLVLGKHWKTATPGERERFKHEFQTLLVRTYSRAFVEYNNWTMSFMPLEVPKQANKVIVKTRVLQPGVQPIEVNYRMLLNKGQWKVYDFMIDGVSLVTNYRSSFNTEIQNKGSLSAVIDDLAKRNTEALAARGS